MVTPADVCSSQSPGKHLRGTHVVIQGVIRSGGGGGVAGAQSGPGPGVLRLCCPPAVASASGAGKVSVVLMLAGDGKGWTQSCGKEAVLLPSLGGGTQLPGKQGAWGEAPPRSSSAGPLRKRGFARPGLAAAKAGAPLRAGVRGA